jgi:hypothetical protein
MSKKMAFQFLQESELFTQKEYLKQVEGNIVNNLQ